MSEELNWIISELCLTMQIVIRQKIYGWIERCNYCYALQIDKKHGILDWISGLSIERIKHIKERRASTECSLTMLIKTCMLTVRGLVNKININKFKLLICSKVLKPTWLKVYM